MFEQDPSWKERTEMNHPALLSLPLQQRVCVRATHFFYFWRQKAIPVGNLSGLILKFRTFQEQFVGAEQGLVRVKAHVRGEWRLMVLSSAASTWSKLLLVLFLKKKTQLKIISFGNCLAKLLKDMTFLLLRLLMFAQVLSRSQPRLSPCRFFPPDALRL